jgi:hypothetical protein
MITVPGGGRIFSGGGLWIEEFIYMYDGEVPYYSLTIRGNRVDFDNLWDEFQPVCEYFASE